MAVDTCWMIVDLKGMPLGIGFTKTQARYNAAEYLMEAAKKEMTFNQAMNEVKKRFHHQSLFNRKYRLSEIDSWHETGPSDGAFAPEKIRDAWKDYLIRQPEIDVLKKNNDGLINRNAALQEENKRMNEYIKWVQQNAGIYKL